MIYKFEKITENKWFNMIVPMELSVEEYINNICVKKPITILLQHDVDNSIGIYGLIKKIGIFSFTKRSNNFFDNTTIKLKENENGVITYIINDTQNLKTFMECLKEFFNQKGKELSNISFLFYETEIEKYIS